MTYLYEAVKPTRLYHKQCPHCGLNYLGKSTLEDVENYPGSGTHWQRHLRKHNVKPIHIWNSDWFYDTSIVEYALDLSEKLNIVESKEWANMKPENGLDGGDNSRFVDYEKTSHSLKGKKLSSETISKRQESRKNGKGWGQNKGTSWSEERREKTIKGMHDRGFDYNKDPEITAKKVSTRHKNGSYKHTDEQKKAASERMKKIWAERKKNGYKMKEETKAKISKTLSNKNKH